MLISANQKKREVNDLHADHREQQAIPVEEVEHLDKYEDASKGRRRGEHVLRGNGTASCR